MTKRLRDICDVEFEGEVYFDDEDEEVCITYFINDKLIGEEFISYEEFEEVFK